MQPEHGEAGLSISGLSRRALFKHGANVTRYLVDGPLGDKDPADDRGSAYPVKPLPPNFLFRPDAMNTVIDI